MEEPVRRDPLFGILFGMFFIIFGVYLFLAGTGYVSWDKWWGALLLAIGIPLVIEFPIRYLNPRYRIRGLVFTRQLIGVVLICFSIGGLIGFGEWWPGLVVIVPGWAIITFSLYRWHERGR